MPIVSAPAGETVTGRRRNGAYSADLAFDRRSLDGLDVLGAVVEAGSFVRAGEALGLTIALTRDRISSSR
jgi:hypothetical protein